jgi:putative heme-binding domain-containing protein
LYRVTVDRKTADTRVEPIDAKIGRAQGLLCAFDSLYVVAHAGEDMPAGLYRVRDTDDDDQYDSVELLREFEGGGEHGPHAVILGPDRKSLFICAGNNTQIPKPERSIVPRLWQEDQLLPRLPDANGHNVDAMAPGGWVCQTDRDGKQFLLLSTGFRNPFDIAFDPNGELFTFDADMEWDIGLPWYRPTRVCHVVPGSEFGWRNGSGKWPPYYADSLPAAVDIGPGSPTGITFGTGARFPAKYQNSLFISDWSYGIIYTVQLEPDGASYSGTSEIFCSAPALPVTDLVVHPREGSLYFLVGGRRSQSALYRVTYNGNESTNSAAFRPLTEPAKHRRRVEIGHETYFPRDPDVLEMHPDYFQGVWNELNNEDRFIRFVARTIVEKTQAKHWIGRALEARDPSQSLEALTALIRVNPPEAENLQQRVVRSLNRLNWEDLTAFQKLHLLRNYGLVMMRLGQPSEKTLATIRKLNRYFPVAADGEGAEALNDELARLLIAADEPAAVPTAMSLMRDSAAQDQQVHYALVLSVAKSGWTTELRQQYFQWFLDAANLQGGNSFGGYLKNIRARAIEMLSESEKTELAELLAREPEAIDPYAELKARPLVRKWSVEDLASVSTEDFSHRDLANGKRMFGVAQCYKCHRISGQGGIAGPDLTPAGRRFGTRDLLECIIDPNKAISDQYQATIFQMDDGRLITGRVVNLNGGEYMVQTDMAKPNLLEHIKVSNIEAMKPSDVSVMPAGLLDSLTRDEILDLVAYLKSTAPIPAQTKSE